MGKLIRDRIPERLAAEGVEVTVVELTGPELVAALRAKVREEAGEVAGADTRAALVEELGDLREVLDALAAAEGVGDEEIRERAAEKRRTHGGFARGLSSTSYDAGARVCVRSAPVPRDTPRDGRRVGMLGC